MQWGFPELRALGMVAYMLLVGIYFESFWRPGDQSRAGTGIGLGLVRDLLAGMGGRVWVGSRLGGGSAFVFTVPLAVSKHLRSAG